MPSDVKALLAKRRYPMKPKTRDIGKNENSQFKRFALYLRKDLI